MSRLKRNYFFASLTIIIMCEGCSSWVTGGTFQRTEQTKLNVRSTTISKVYVNNRFAGVSDVTIPLDYTQRIDKKTRDVNYWVTQPGWSLFFTLISIGIYLPFSLIPTDSETMLTPTGEFSDNEFDVAIEAPGFERWSQRIVCRGQDSQSVSADLVPINTVFSQP